MKNKGTVILTIVEALGGLLTIVASVGSLFIKDEEPQCPLLSQLDWKDLDDHK